MRGSRVGRGRAAAFGATPSNADDRRTSRKNWGVLAAVVAALLAAPTAYAQSSVQPGVIEREYEEARPPRPSTEITIPSVDAPRAWEDAQAVRFVLNRVEIDGNVAIGDQELMQPFVPLIGREVSIAEVFSAAEGITHIYDGAGYALSLAYVPAQEVRDGVVVVRVVEGFIAEVAIRDSQDTRSGRWDDFAERLKESRPLRSEVLERTLLLANDLAGVKVKSVFERIPNAAPGAMRLVMSIDRKAVGVHAEVNNRGSSAIGPIREFLNIDLNGLLGNEERITVFGVGALDGMELAYFGGRLDFPVSSEGTVVSLEASRSETDPGTPALSAVDFKGEGWTASFGVSHAFIRSLRENLYGSMGVVYKDLKSRLLGTNASKDRIRAVAVGLDYDSRDRWGGLWRAVATLFIGVDAFDATKEGDPLASRAGASGKFARIEGAVSHLVSISPYASFYAEIAGQVADGPLLVSEQCGYGGGHIGRAFDPFEITGDHCVKGRAEFRFDIPVRSDGMRSVIDGVQFYALADFGVMIKAGTLLPLEERVESAESIGLGVRVRASEYLSGFAEVVRPIGRGVALENGSKEARFFFGISADY